MAGVKRRLKLVISAVYWLMFLSWRGILWRFGVPRAAECVVLLYHGVPGEMRGRFEAQMRVLGKMARPVPIESLMTRPLDGLNAIVTFDDAFVSVGENAAGILRRLNIPAAVFVPAAFMGQKPGWPAGTDADEDIMSAEQLRALPPDLFSIASHSVTHPHLNETDDAGLKWELTRSREIIEQVTGRPARYFSYPYGESSSRVEAAVLEAGYDAAFSIRPVPVRQRCLSNVGRICVEPTDGAVEFRLKLVGAYRWMARVSILKRAPRAFLRRLAARGARPCRGRAIETEEGGHGSILGR